MQYDAYLFDLYGTLIDIRTHESNPALWETVAAHYSALGAQWTGETIREAYKAECARQPAKETQNPEIDLAPVFEALFTQRGVTPTREQIAEAAWLFRSTSTEHLTLYEGAEALLKALRKRGKVILLSNAQVLFTRPELKLLGIDGAFDRIYISSAYGCKKPDPAFFGQPVRDFGLDPARCIMIGNDPYCDAAGARAVGMAAWCIRSEISPEEAPLTLYDQPEMDLRLVRDMLCK